MKTITTKAVIDTDRKLTVQLPAGIQTGEYEVVLVLNNSAVNSEETVEIVEENEQQQLNEAFENWLKEVEALPVSSNAAVVEFEVPLTQNCKEGIV